jgi:hypothetical protein
VKVLPASVRSWFSLLKSQATASVLQEYTTKRESPPLVQSELDTARGTKSSGMIIKASSGQREVVASIEVDDGVMLDLAIALPACYPLQPAEVRCGCPRAVQPHTCNTACSAGTVLFMSIVKWFQYTVVLGMYAGDIEAHSCDSGEAHA